MAVKIALIGAGNIGSRHLQALALLNRDAEIFVVDSFKESLNLSKERFEQVYCSREKEAYIKVAYSTDISSVPEDTELVIIATSAKPRRKIVESLLESIKGLKYMILEKILFQSTIDLYEVGLLLKQHNIKAYVNCARRNYKFYHELKNQLVNEPYINMDVQGGEWGMGCNGIHMFDIYAFITGCNSFIADNSLLDKNIYPSKRADYVEFFGQERITCNRGRLTMSSEHNSKANIYTTIFSEKYHYFIDQTANIIEFRCLDDGWKKHEITPDFLPVSKITQINVESLLDNGTCDLTTYDESVIYHNCLINSFLNHYNSVTREEKKECPIT